MKKRILSILLALCLTLALLPMAVFAATEVASGTCGDNLTWTLDSSGKLTISGRGAMPNYEALESPAPWDGDKSQIKTVVLEPGVTSIGDGTFYECSNLSSVTIPNSVTSIGGTAFQGCTGLTSITIPNSVVIIGWRAFKDCTGLTSVTIPSSVTTIGDAAFQDCTGLTSITIPNSVTSIGWEAFYGCTSLTGITIPNSVTSIGGHSFVGCNSLTSVTIPNSVTSIGVAAFSGCRSLQSITVGANNSKYASQNGVLYTKDMTELVQYPGGKTGAFTIPNSVTGIGLVAFDDCAGLTSVTIPNSMTHIWQRPFAGCSSLQTITVEANNPAFASLNGVLYTKDMTELIDYPSGKAGAFTIPSSVTSIGVSAFDGCSSLTSVTIPNSVTSIRWGTFNWCTSLKTVVFQGNMPQCGDLFDHVTANVYYPAGNKTYTADNMIDYGGSLTWIPYSKVTITGHPGTKTVEAGKNAQFGVIAKGAELTYQWQYRFGNGAWTNTTLSGNKTSLLTVPATTARNGCQYRCMVKDVAGNVAYSNAATLTVKAPTLKITGHPLSKSVTVNTNAKFGVIASGTGLTYQWQYRFGKGAWTNTTLSGNKTSLLTVPATAARNGCQYRCVVKDSCGQVVYSNPATLTVKVAELKITGHPGSKTVEAGKNAQFGVTASGTGLTYQWQYRFGNGAWTNTTLSGNKTSLLTVPATVARNGCQYRCVVKDSSGNVAYSNAATLTVKASTLKITGHPGTKTVEAGKNAQFGVIASGTGLTYQWQYRFGNGAWTNTTLSGNKTSLLTVPATTARNGCQYRCVVKDSAGNVAYSNPATLTVK